MAYPSLKNEKPNLFKITTEVDEMKENTKMKNMIMRRY